MISLNIKHNELTAEEFFNDHSVPGTEIFVEPCAMPDKIQFYEKFGFSANEAQRLRKYLRVRE